LRDRGFTLLEVMVAVAILGLSLTVILSAQAGLYSGGGYAQHTSVAIGLLRCKMTEVEERLLKLGYPEADTNDDGACCEDDSRPDMRCSWKIERVELPQMKPPDLAPASSAAITQLATNPGAFAGDGGVSSLASALQEGTGGVGGIESLAMTFVYPILKPMLEASIRKVTVKIAWHEGSQDRDITIVQYLTRPMRPPPLAPGAASGQSPLVPGLPGLPGLFPGLPSSGRGASP
jgi:general secretion pathway protein I